MMEKRIFAALLTAVMLLGLLPGLAMAAVSALTGAAPVTGNTALTMPLSERG